MFWMFYCHLYNSSPCFQSDGLRLPSRHDGHVLPPDFGRTALRPGDGWRALRQPRGTTQKRGHADWHQLIAMGF